MVEKEGQEAETLATETEEAPEQEANTPTIEDERNSLKEEVAELKQKYELAQKGLKTASDTMAQKDRESKSQAGMVIANQLLRSGTSVGANYRAVCKARSKADFIAKLGIVEEEVDESAYWLEMIIEASYDNTYPQKE